LTAKSDLKERSLHLVTVTITNCLAACYELTLILCFSCFILLLFVANKFLLLSSSNINRAFSALYTCTWSDCDVYVFLAVW